MMRLSSISVFAFSLLASVAPAAAQGAWVLWSTYAETRTEEIVDLHVAEGSEGAWWPLSPPPSKPSSATRIL